MLEGTGSILAAVLLHGIIGPLGRAERLQTDIDNLDRRSLSLQAVAEGAIVRLVKCARDGLAVTVRDPLLRNVERDLVVLLGITAIKADAKLPELGRHVFLLQEPIAFAPHLLKDALEPRPIERCESRHKGTHEIMRKLRQQHAICAEHRSRSGHDLQRDLKLATDQA